MKTRIPHYMCSLSFPPIIFNHISHWKNVGKVTQWTQKYPSPSLCWIISYLKVMSFFISHFFLYWVFGLSTFQPIKSLSWLVCLHENCNDNEDPYLFCFNILFLVWFHFIYTFLVLFTISLHIEVDLGVFTKKHVNLLHEFNKRGLFIWKCEKI